MTDKHNESDERIGAWERVADHPLFKECYAAESPLIDAMIAKLDDLDATRNEVNRLRDALSTNSDDDLCICITAGPALEGPDEYCLTHGRTKAEWMEKYDAAQKRLNELDPDPFAIPEAPKFEGCTIEEWAKQAKETHADLQKTLAANVSLREQIQRSEAEHTETRNELGATLYANGDQIVKLEAALEAAWEYAAAALGEQAAIREHASARVAVLETAGHVRSADENTRDKYHAALAARDALKEESNDE